MTNALHRAIAACDGAGALASAIGVSVQRLSNWRTRGIPTDVCPLIERATRERGKPVLCEELRPDVLWSVLRQAGPMSVPTAADQVERRAA
ncbi:YdaS family helix-turn-helix protein [Leptothrix discophora]|uniref:YdaS family helix-turn-helix protein n=1 Tax=Leptothrix discophora TaxID=89 RepID=A0ABT9G1J5_LEPDI|nr:YdaS family helix-turn-helix protein [Leptothrix discophora]MDP4300365.1 YdaS family helix-turn-helix protein [Leptothrix discophora]